MIFGFLPVYVSFRQFFAGINRHKLVFVTDWHKLSLRRHFANPGFNTGTGVWRYAFIRYTNVFVVRPSYIPPG